MNKICLGFQKSSTNGVIIGYKNADEYDYNVCFSPGHDLNTDDLFSYTSFPISGSVYRFGGGNGNNYTISAQHGYSYGWYVVYNNNPHLIYMNKDKDIVLKKLPFPDEPYEIELYLWELDSWESTCTKTTAHLTPPILDLICWVRKVVGR